MKKSILLSLILGLVAVQANAAVTLLDKDQWKVLMGGFVEVDTIVDSTRSFVETIGNTAVSNNSVTGQVGRTQLSIRNSRMAFTVEAPEYEGWKTKGYFEFDLLGYDPTPGNFSGSTAVANNEAAFFNNPTYRVRHVYLAGESDGWQVMAGQYWNLFGWQPYYFIPTLEVAPVPAMLYGRTGQVRVTKSMKMDDNTLQAAVGVMRPPQRDAQWPGLEGGLRYTFGNRSGAFTGGATGAQKPQPMSIGITGAFREFATPTNPASPTADITHTPGYAVAADVLLPVVASQDGKDPSNNLVFGGEFTTGQGYGDQFNSWTGGMSNPLNSSSVSPSKNVNLDAGIGDYDSAGNFQLVDLRTFNAYAQYHLPAESRTWISAGYGRLYSDNMNLLTPSAGKTSSGGTPYDKEQVYFGNIAHDLTKQVRVGFEFAHIRTEYADGYNAHNNRYQLSAWFIF